MEELEQILREHAGKYPLMQPADAVKLIFQNEFGGGHLIPNPKSCLDYLKNEWEESEFDEKIPLFERIGNGIVRINLAALRPELLGWLGEAFLQSAAAHTGNRASFEGKLEVLRRLTQQGCFAFDLCALDAYLTDYTAVGYPAVSHSAQYRTAYHPAYRVIETRFLPRNLVE